VRPESAASVAATARETAAVAGASPVTGDGVEEVGEQGVDAVAVHPLLGIAAPVLERHHDAVTVGA
jgi:hypothetical protein